jgi:RNA 2',3'-cyclic 3'-phosphodiesterase
VLTRLGFPPDERRYTPHVTLARLKGTTEGRLQVYLTEHALYRAPPFHVERFSLIASYLTKSGAIYEDQADYRLS